MTKSRTTLAILGTLAIQAAIGTAPALAADSCPNAAIRSQQNSTALPDCRAYELVSPDLNHATLAERGVSSTGRASADGETVAYQAYDVPEHANSGEITSNSVRSKRDVAGRWSGVGLSPPLVSPVTAYWAFNTGGISADLSSTFVWSDQPLEGGPLLAGGQHGYVGHPDGTYTRVTNVASPPRGSSVAGTADFSHVYFGATSPQLPGAPSGSLYSWSQDEGLDLVGILPDGTPAPGISFRGASTDGRYVLFGAGEKLYLRVDDSQTIEVSASRRTVDPDPVSALAEPVGMAPDGSKVLFTSRAELTNDAYTGRDSGGARNYAGRDLYSYDTASGELKDLTVDSNPADVAGGAQIQANSPDFGATAPDAIASVQATDDESVVYFVAKGLLAPGATAGQRSIYAWHDGQIDFIARADGLVRLGGSNSTIKWWVSADGRRLAFESRDSLTGYDNADPVTGDPHVEVFLATLGSPVVCVSCRANGTRPTGDAKLPLSAGLFKAPQRLVSDDGRRMFFHSTDAVVPQASSGLQQVFQYSNGSASLISRADASYMASFLDVSASGDDVFFTTRDDVLANPNSGDQLVFDARVGGGVPIPVSSRCSGPACRAAGAPPVLPVAASVKFADGDARKTTAARVSVSKVKAIAGMAGSLKVRVPGRGRLTVSGVGLRTRRSSPARARTVTVRLTLSKAAARSLEREQTLRRTVRVVFTDSGGQTSTARLSVTFKARAGSTRKGR